MKAEKIEITAVYRILDANFNRLREGLRVLEEVARLVDNNASAAASLKSIRHAVSQCENRFDHALRLKARDSENDVGREGSRGLESSRENLNDIVVANFKRCQEAARALEEFSKLLNGSAAEEMKGIRFALYDFEKIFTL